MRMQSLGWIKDQLLILRMFIPQVKKEIVYQLFIDLITIKIIITIKHFPLIININFLFHLKEIVYILFRRDQQRYKEAIIYYEQTLKMDPNDQYTINQIAILNYQIRILREEIEAMNILIQKQLVFL